MARRKLPGETIDSELEGNDTATQISTLLNLFRMNVRPRYDKNDPDAIAQELDNFFEFCIENDMRPGVELMCSYLGITRTEMVLWQNGGGRRAQVINSAKQLLDALLEQWGAQGTINPTTLIWWQKNHSGYQDVVTLEARPSTSLDSLPTKNEILSRLPEDDEGETPLIEDWSEGDAGEES